MLNDEIQNRVNEMRTELGSKGEEAYARNRGEAFRQFLSLVLAKLPVDTRRGHAYSAFLPSLQR